MKHLVLYVTSCPMEVREVSDEFHKTAGTRPTTWIERPLLTVAEIWLSSCRVITAGNAEARSILGSEIPVIIALWHFSLIYILFHFRHRKAVIMVSGSSDGDWVARCIKRWGQIPVRGSRLKGGIKALRDMAGAMRRYNIGAGIVADGSRGPARIAQKGALILSRDTGAPVIPIGFTAKPAIMFNSWDKTILPWPFSKIVLTYGKPFYVPNDARGPALESYRKLLEDELNQATTMAENVLTAGQNNR
ncbi:MAG: lysophospholipid acyltransferase family protein [Dissulfurimicrobium sp.]|uniref:lysophospholipid acyltransferase family protein n=1 Tax=Dissulfurimicrobium TaxID=1769732 RepID=UPI001EDA22B2|nr:lysophospholipid acyltransferase family protein [Dissulfurimicrobium hydrothermale]UKL13177.1 lysophospholipid acyltransferase family protein [Dissulfurimicrobium hydrothermale]